ASGFSPKMGELGRDDLIVRNRCREQTDGLSKTVHMGDGLLSDGWIVVREITPNQFRDKFRFGRGKALLAHFCGSAHVFFERLMGFHDGPDCRASAIRFVRDPTFGSYERGESIMLRLRRSVTPTNIQHHLADTTAQRDFATHAVGPEAVELAFFQRLRRREAEGNIRPCCAGTPNIMYIVLFRIDARLDQQTLKTKIYARSRPDA